MIDRETHYQCEFTAAEMGLVASALESYRDYLKHEGQQDYEENELEEAISTCDEAISEVTHRL